MLSIRTLALTAAVSFAIAPAAFAQDAAGDTASGKRFSVVGSATILQPDDHDLAGAKIDVDGDVAPTLSASYHFTDNIAVELWGAADRFNHRVKSDATGKIGTVDSQPLALSAQYHFGHADNTFRPFVGLGYHQTNISREDLNPGGDHIGLTSPKGAIGTVGVDMNINPTWFARADARYLDGDADARIGGQTVGGDIRFNPWTVGVGIGARF